jgi:hypothetical protein
MGAPTPIVRQTLNYPPAHRRILASPATCRARATLWPHAQAWLAAPGGVAGGP